MGGRSTHDIKPGYISMILTYLSFFNIIIIGHIRDQFGKIFCPSKYRHFVEHNGFPPFFSCFDSFFIRRLYKRISDCWNRPIHGITGREIEILERVSHDYNNTMTFTNEKIKAINTGSYNYLGLTINEMPFLDDLLDAMDKFPTNYAYPSGDYEGNTLVRTLEKEVAEFLYQEDCVVFGMGYGVNTSVIPALMQNSLILSDEYNHMSIIKGIKLSNSKSVIFSHNDMNDLEKKLKFHISQGDPETHMSWERVFVVIEGLFSMEGTVPKLAELVQLKKKYKFYIYMDEAHSLGGIGKTGRGACEYSSIDFNEIDVLMGTFSKSFCGLGGYIAGKKDMVNFVRKTSNLALYGEQMAPAVAMQIILSIRSLKNDSSRMTRLQQNIRIMRDELEKRKFWVIGDESSPVIPILILTPGKIADFSRLCLENGVAVAVVGYPATPVLLNRARLCVSASHTESDIKKIIKVIDRVGSVLDMKK